MESNCKFCNPNEEEILFKSDNFYILLSYGPMTEGYVLINSNKHFDCCGSIDKCIADEFDSLVNTVKRILITVYGSCLFYEHGRAGSCLGQVEKNIHCYHAHMHCVPVNIRMNDLMDNTFLAISINSLSDLRKQYNSTRQPYLFVDDGQKYIYFINKVIRSQYLRSIVAKELGAEKLWDWASYPELDKVKKAKEKLLPFFSNINKL
jgi:diadenosine tetraphosphate (Ap4A) HIT family hydrolase